MKRSTRILLKITLLFAVVGAAFGIAGFCLGFERDQLSDCLLYTSPSPRDCS